MLFAAWSAFAHAGQKNDRKSYSCGQLERVHFPTGWEGWAVVGNISTKEKGGRGGP